MNKKTIQIVLILSIAIQGCASFQSQRDHVLLGAGAGGAIGAVSGAGLSPNDESRGMNALVFGLSGAIIGGLVGFFTPSIPDSKKGAQNLEEKDMASRQNNKEYSLSPNEELPDYIKKRLSPTVVEEFIENDQVGEDGSLHAPHKVYRIKHPAELIAKPDPAATSEKRSQ